MDKTLIIAEAGVNHNGDFSKALNLIDAAVDAGADCIKFQTYMTELLVEANAPKADYQKSFGSSNESQYSMLKKLELSFDQFHDLKKYCDQKGIIFLSTPFDKKSADFLQNLVPLFKISSGDLNNLPFLFHIASKKLPVILSTGMSTLSEIKTVMDFVKRSLGEYGCDSERPFKLAGVNLSWLNLLHCTTSYPTPFVEANLNVIQSLKGHFSKLAVGYSDHTLGVTAPNFCGRIRSKNHRKALYLG